jgi:phosphoenolpyruvate synthase/pyruvate phosphate dikinase
MTDLVLDISELRRGHLPVAGSKLARLGELAARGWRVPDGYVVTVAALDRWLPAATADELERIVDDWPSDPDAARDAAARARALIEDEPVPTWLDEAVGAAHERLAARTGAGDELRVAVRSSGVAEDGAQASFAGQFGTYLGVSGSDAVLDALRRCWASPYGWGAIDYRRRNGLPASAARLAVGVLELVDAVSAGVAFTVDPVSGDDATIVIEGSWGLGEAIVSGRVTPDRWSLDRATGHVKKAEISYKERWSVLAAGAAEVAEEPVPDHLRDRPCLEEDQLRRLCAEAVRLADDEGAPQDVEWAFDRAGELYLLQHRPITTGPPPAYDPIQYALGNVFGVPER